MAGTIKKAAQAVANALPSVTGGSSDSHFNSKSSSSSRPTEISLPASTPFTGNTSGSGKTPRTPRTPADEAIAYFSAEGQQQEEVQIWELPLEDDGGPNDARSVSPIPCSLSSAGILLSLRISDVSFFFLLMLVHPATSPNDPVHPKDLVVSRFGRHSEWSTQVGFPYRRRRL